MITNKPLILLFILMLGTGWAFQVDVVVPYNETSQVVIDGTINQNEYAGHYEESNTGMQIHWEHNGENMYIGLVSPGTGWVAVGFGPLGQKMDKANVILGAVDDATGEATLSDQSVSGRSHTEDSHNNIIEGAGTQRAEETLIEFVFPLNSGDDADHSFEMGGTYGFIVACHASSDDFGSKHTKRVASLSLQIESPLEITGKPTTEPTTESETTEVPELAFSNGNMVLLLFVIGGFITITCYRISKKYL
ncbi:MAG: DOMON domain-containing protein [Candidatus Heimdallarchaeota archaeon]